MKNKEIINEYFDLTQSQLMIWIGQRLKPTVPLYNEALIWQLEGPIDENCFRQAFQKLVDLSQSMRLTFIEFDGQPKQQVVSNLGYQVEILDWSDRAVSQKDILDWASLQTQKIFDLSKCLFESILIKISEDRYIWYFNEHHLITDSWTQSLLFKRLSNLYESIKNGDRSEYDHFHDYSTFLDFERNQAKYSNRLKIENYWKEKVSRKQLRTIYGIPTRSSSTESKRISLTLSSDISGRIRQLADSKEARTWSKDLSIFNIFSALLFTFLHRVSGEDKITMGSPIHNRPSKSLKETTGMFIEIFPLTADLSDKKMFCDLIAEVRAETTEFIKNAVPGVSQPDWSKAYNVILNYMNMSFEDFSGIPCETTWIHSNHIDTSHILRLQVHDFNSSGKFQLHFDLNMGIFSNYQIETIPVHFVALLDAFLDNPNQALGQPPLVALKKLKKSARSFPDLYKKSVIDLIAQQAI
ncbi:MAG: condensation domain-containing protein [Bacteroidetes bacterium]|nr:condensation domain-containing protein [Bacteroidota bacterium]MDA1119630.1 condensation domain-containing protein [Bacteroidota bacterium]